MTHLSDAELAGFSADDFSLVRAATSAYGHHLFGKVRIPALPDEGPAYIHFRAFTPGPDEQASLHSIREYLPCICIYIPYQAGPWVGLVEFVCETVADRCGGVADTEDAKGEDGGHTFRAIFTKDDELKWFDT